MLLKHLVFVITGANRGFGKIIAETIASSIKGTKTSLILVGRDLSQLEKIQLSNDTVSCHYIAEANLEGAKKAEDTVINKLNSMIKEWKDRDIAPITEAILINNAGSTGDLSKKVGDYTASEIEDYVNLNITSYISLVNGFIGLFNTGLIKVKIVNISSLLAVQAFPNWGLYASGKSARDMLLKVIAKEEVFFFKKKEKKSASFFVLMT
ncbi:uncharacterized protein BX663DRAFT_571010 [Cokeromyces recurvatus]|uniref:uncharacterized protein n=1 Tax=Cokeromyces recurvatus TaxID=90255 RepID=UPI00221E92AC|nr:uncharacterized protein BX663DRAFT_571010 [Cokeromyces recurvatus]KAI7901776.1 hypothetical protein BX663DRAFT_571010 [Cokeromyces recurvatus]